MILTPFAESRVKKKINLIGDPAVGKTSLILRFVNNVFGEKYLKTIGTNVYTKEIQLIGGFVKLVIVDIMGEKDFQWVQETAFRQSAGALAVADATRKETLDNLIENWIPKYRSVTPDTAPIILAVNKNDLDDKEITLETLDGKTTSHFSHFFFTSAKTGKDVEEAFRSLGAKSLFQTTSLEPEVEKVMMNKTIDTPKKLLSCLFNFTACLGDISYFEREDALVKVGMDKFQIEEDISEEKVLEFGRSIIKIYEDKKDMESVEAVERVMEKYKREKDID